MNQWMMDMIPETMKARVTMGHGNFDLLVWHEDWPVPTAASGEVLIQVGACGLNNKRHQHADWLVFKGGQRGHHRRGL